MNNKKTNENKITYSYKTSFITLGRILASPNKQKILYSLNIPKTPKEISKHTNLNFPTTSKTIKELEELSLVEIKNKNLRKGKIVSISKKGATVVEDLKSREN